MKKVRKNNNKSAEYTENLALYQHSGGNAEIAGMPRGNPMKAPPSRSRLICACKSGPIFAPPFKGELERGMGECEGFFC